MRNLLLVVSLFLMACPKPTTPDGGPPPTAKDSAAPTSGSVTVTNGTANDETVYFSFGADSVVLPAAWSFCTVASPLNCSFTLKAHVGQVLPSPGYLNVTMAFGGAVACGSTKAELNVNNPAWYDVADVSLVDGYSNKVSITIDGKVLGPPVGKDGNEKVYGLFPLGCDICVARKSPPCGMKPGRDGCKAGTQYKPDVPCQHQGSKMGGGSTIVVTHVS